MTFQTEFPDFPAADMPSLPATFTDVSWHNDTCPCIASDVLRMQIFIDYSEVAKREFPTTSRFSVMEQSGGVEIGCGLLDTDDWSEVLALIAARSAQ